VVLDKRCVVGIGVWVNVWAIVLCPLFICQIVLVEDNVVPRVHEVLGGTDLNVALKDVSLSRLECALHIPLLYSDGHHVVERGYTLLMPQRCNLPIGATLSQPYSITGLESGGSLDKITDLTALSKKLNQYSS